MEPGKQEATEAKSTPKSVLLSTAIEYRQLEIAGLDDLEKDRDSEEYMKKLREMTQLIKDLPDKIRQTGEQGHRFLGKERAIINWSQDAERALESDDSFRMSMLLANRATTEESSDSRDSNNLEHFIQSAYPEDLS